MPKQTVYLCDWQQGKRPCRKSVLEDEGSSLALNLTLEDETEIKLSAVFCGDPHLKAFNRHLIAEDYQIEGLETGDKEDEEEPEETQPADTTPPASEEAQPDADPPTEEQPGMETGGDAPKGKGKSADKS